MPVAIGQICEFEAIQNSICSGLKCDFKTGCQKYNMLLTYFFVAL